MKRTLSIVVVSLLATSGIRAQSSTWGSFDASRINYPAGPLTGTAHSALRGIIAANGGSVSAATATLTASYLSGVSVFYTSLLSQSTGALSASEQTDLRGWVAGGGTLIVSADIFPLAAYDSFTDYFGVTGYTALFHNSTGTPLAAHQITAGVGSYSYQTEAKFSFGPDALLLGDNGFGDAFMAVLEPATGFTGGGRILVMGDHNMFTDTFIGLTDNALLAANIAQWAGSAPTVVPEPSTMTLVMLGAGLLLLTRRRVR